MSLDTPAPEWTGAKLDLTRPERHLSVAFELLPPCFELCVP